MNYIIGILLITSVFFVSQAPAADDWNFQPWSDSMFVQLEKEFGKQGATRVRKLHDIVVENKDASIDVKLKVTNDAINQLPWIADRDKYDANDYWATPMETIATFGGDCEDMAIAKLMMLRLMGVPRENLRLTYVKIKKTGEAHMILTYTNEPDKPVGQRPVYLLDNYVKKIKLAKDRKDLLGVYIIDVNKNLVLIDDDGKSRSEKAKIDSAKYSKLDKIKKKIADNRARYQQYNDGRPIY